MTPPMHLAVPVDDLAAARRFYGDVLGLARGRESDHWIDWNLYGHQFVTHQATGPRSEALSEVDGHRVPVPHFGVLLDPGQFHDLADRLRAAGVEFLIEPYLRFPGQPGEQWTMFFRDPAGNALEFKAFRDPAQVFATDRTSADEDRVVRASREIAADAAVIFELVADPARQPAWDGNDNLATAAPGQRVRGVGDVFTTVLTRGSVRENHVVEFAEGRRLAWRPAEPGSEPPGHLWRWELEPVGSGRTMVTHTYDWSRLTDQRRFERARSTTTDRLMASLDRLAAYVEGDRPT
ncbi:extradiol dioxygenase family protein [Labedaea rhizosphaerae]|uniref:Extradiol dioxygenase family protein n=1 Tax=Labedaea rhizosphaerae TaxID=598644 RepID=A0A4R6RW57_LABRH|nr:extradiol dioxygenase family protein [Labedaea rhizosphaerae]